MKKTFILTVITLCMTLKAIAFAGMGLPADLQVALFYKIFDFDRSLSELQGQEIVIGIFYDPHNPESEQAEEEIKRAFSQVSERTLVGKRVVIKEIMTVGQVNKGINILYVTPGNNPSIGEIIKQCEKNKIFGIAGTEEYGKAGLPVAIGIENNKPKIIVNKSEAEQCGVKLSSQLLALAQIV